MMRSVLLRLLWIATSIIATVVATSIVSPSKSYASPGYCYQCIHHVGLDVFYLHRSDCKGPPSDPINVLWYDKSRTSYFAGPVGDNMTALGYGNNDQYDVPGPDPMGILGYPPATRPCHTQASDRADGRSLDPDRYHVRLYDLYAQGIQRYYVVGDAHHDEGAPLVYCGKHESVDYISARKDIYNRWPGNKHNAFWGNTRPIRQCGGDRTTASNGYVAEMSMKGR